MAKDPPRLSTMIPRRRGNLNLVSLIPSMVRFTMKMARKDPIPPILKTTKTVL